MEKYEFVKEIGSGCFGVTKLMRNKDTDELVAMKFLERGGKINEQVVREIINHRSLRHPNVVQFKEVVLTPTHLAIVMEYAAGGELFQLLNGVQNGRFSEIQARYFFQQLITGVEYCHSQGICHRDLKLENTLLDGSDPFRVKICDFGYSKSSLLHSRAKSVVGTPAYVAPEVCTGKEYDGKAADIWSCGVVLYAMLFGKYPFDDKDPTNFKKTLHNIMAARYTIPFDVSVSQECKHLFSRIFVRDPLRRIRIKEIKSHPWFLKKLYRVPTEAELAGYSKSGNQSYYTLQSVEDIMKIIEKAKQPPAGEDEEEDEAIKKLENKVCQLEIKG